MNEVNLGVASHVELVTRALLGNVGNRCNLVDNFLCGGVVSGNELPSSTVSALGDLVSIAISVDFVTSLKGDDVPPSEDAFDCREIFLDFVDSSLSVAIRHSSFKSDLLEVAPCVGSFDI